MFLIPIIICFASEVIGEISVTKRKCPELEGEAAEAPNAVDC